MVVASLTDEEVAYLRSLAESDIGKIDDDLGFGVRPEYRAAMGRRREVAQSALARLVQSAPRTPEQQAAARPSPSSAASRTRPSVPENPEAENPEAESTPPRPLAARLREARQFLGLSVEQVAEAAGVAPLDVESWEVEGGQVPGRHLRRLSRLYRRPVDWLCGTEVPWQPGARLLAEAGRRSLTQHDRDVLLDFAEWLATAGPVPESGRREGEG